MSRKTLLFHIHFNLITVFAIIGFMWIIANDMGQRGVAFAISAVVFYSCFLQTFIILGIKQYYPEAIGEQGTMWAILLQVIAYIAMTSILFVKDEREKR